jgi:hypothetical protein
MHALFSLHLRHKALLKTNRKQLVPLGLQNRTFGPYLAAAHRVRIPIVQSAPSGLQAHRAEHLTVGNPDAVCRRRQRRPRWRGGHPGGVRQQRHRLLRHRRPKVNRQRHPARASVRVSVSQSVSQRAKLPHDGVWPM